jgi:hypothetical protein
MSHLPNHVNMIAKKRRTSSSATGLRNLGPSARMSLNPTAIDVLLDAVDGEGDDVHGYDGPSLPDRPPRKFLPSQRQAMSLLCMALPPEDRPVFQHRFCAFATGDSTPSCLPNGMVCNTSVAWITGAFGLESAFHLHSAADMFPSSGQESSSLSEVYVLDVILNRSPVSHLPVKDDDIVLVRSYHEDDLDDANDYKFRTMILFLPQCGVFYCARERRGDEVGVSKTLVALDMSWLCLGRSHDLDGNFSSQFGEGGYVKKFTADAYGQYRHACSDGKFRSYWSHHVSGWRICFNTTLTSQQNRVCYRVSQCLDSEGPKMPPDVFDGHEQADLRPEYLRALYNERLAFAKSATKKGRHYAQGCHHYRLSQNCWVIDPTTQHFVDIMVDLPDVGNERNRQSVVMVRNVNFLTDENGVGFATEMACIRDNDVAVRLAASTGQARQNLGDFGAMHAFGTRVMLDGSLGAYKANDVVEEKMLRDMVVALAKIGRAVYPQVYAVIRDTEGNSGVEPVVPMDGDGVHRVGYTVDMSVDLGNASHVDFNDGSQGFSLWGEEFPGRATNWFLVMPNIHGMRPRGDEWISFDGLAIKITDGVSISWDGRNIRHCTSISEPDGIPLVTVGNKLTFTDNENHTYGTFTSAKERIVDVGRRVSLARARARAAEKAALLPAIAATNCDEETRTRKRTRRKPRKNKKRSGRKVT